MRHAAVIQKLCCNVLEWNQEAFSEKCFSERPAYGRKLAGYFEPYLIDDCDENLCPSGTICEQINPLYARCCIDERGFNQNTGRTSRAMDQSFYIVL